MNNDRGSLSGKSEEPVIASPRRGQSNLILTKALGLLRRFAPRNDTWPRLRPIDRARRDWVIAVGYVLLIYSTLSVARIPLNFLRELGMLRLTLAAVYLLLALWIIRGLLKEKAVGWWRWAALVGIFFVYYLFGRRIHSPEEQTHFFEYGFVGFFFLRALRWRGNPQGKAQGHLICPASPSATPRHPAGAKGFHLGEAQSESTPRGQSTASGGAGWGYSWKSYIAAFVLACLAGWIDELIQKILPNRYYDVNDIVLNFVASLLGLILCGLFPSLSPYKRSK